MAKTNRVKACRLQCYFFCRRRHFAELGLEELRNEMQLAGQIDTDKR